MNRKHLTYAVAVALTATLALSGCKQKEEPAPTPAVVEAAPAPAPMPAATVSVTGVELGNAVDADMKVVAPMTSFGKKDTIFAAISTATSDPAATVPGKLAAKWSFQDGQVINDESKELNFSGAGVTDFQVSKPDGWPAGNYTLEIMLDGNVVQSKEFSVK